LTETLGRCAASVLATLGVLALALAAPFVRASGWGRGGGGVGLRVAIGAELR